MPHKKKTIKPKKVLENKKEIVKRGRKKKGDTYFGREEEDAVAEFLKAKYIIKHNFLANKPNTITHNLGLNVTVNVYYLTPNENCYGNDSKFITINVNTKLTKPTNNSIDIATKIDIKDAFVIITDEVKQSKIYNEYLKYPFERMVELIIKKYKLYRANMTLEEQIDDTISFLITKAAKFEPARNKKAYSYYGTVCKHYNLGLVQKERKTLNQSVPYEERAEEIENREDLSYRIDDNNQYPVELFIKKISLGIKKELENDNLGKKKLTDNERKVGDSLIEILDNWELSLQTMDGSHKFNKNSVLETMRNLTNLSTKDIRIAMKRFKEMYEILKQAGIDNDE